MAEGIDFGKQIGPLPLGAWIVVVAGGLGIALWSRQQQDAGTVIVEDTSGVPGVGEGPGWIAVPPPTGSPPTGEIEYQTNDAWGIAAINWLIAQGYAPGISNSAITKALNGGEDISGNKMSIMEWSLWVLALTKFGSPPYPIHVQPPTDVPGPVIPPVEPPPNKPPPPPTNNKVPPHHTVVARRGDTISGISARHGEPNWRKTWEFNLKYRSKATAAIMRARGPNLIFAGTTIWVPK